MTRESPGTEPSAAAVRAPHGHRPQPDVQGWQASILGFSLFAFVTSLLRLGAHGLMGMEGMVIDGGRRMLDSGMWAVPRVYGEIYTYKPAFAYWMSASTQALWTEPNEFVLRLPMALSAVLAGLVALVLLGRAASPRAGFYAGCTVVGTALFLEKVRVAEFDVPLMAAVVVAVVAASCNLTRDRDSAPLWFLAYLALAAAFLTKGMPALMTFGPGLLLAAYLNQRLDRLFGWRHLLAAVSFLAVTVSYFWWAVASAGWMVFDHPRTEAGWRSVGWTLESFGLTLAKPLLIFLVFLPWSLLVLRAPAVRKRLDSGRSGLLRAGLGFLIGGMLSFVIVPTHETRYYLPLVGGLAIIVGIMAETVTDRSEAQKLRLAARGLLLLLSVALIAALFVEPPDSMILAAAAALTAVGLVLASRSWALPRLLVAAATVLALAQMLIATPRRAEDRDLSAVAQSLGRHLPSEATIYVAAPANDAGKHSSLYYYLDRPIETFSNEDPPPVGGYVVLVNTESVPPGLGSELLESIDHPRFDFRLERVLGAPTAAP